MMRRSNGGNGYARSTRKDEVNKGGLYTGRGVCVLGGGDITDLLRDDDHTGESENHKSWGHPTWASEARHQDRTGAPVVYSDAVGGAIMFPDS